MKKVVCNLLTGVVVAASMVSCNSDNKENVINPEDRTSVVIHTVVETKAYDNVWERGDKIGVTMYDPAYETIIEDQFNKDYITNTRLGIFNPVDEGQIMYFPDDNSEIRLKSYYPYVTNITEDDQVVHWSVADQSNLPAIDLMTAEHVSGFNKQADVVRLNFYHRLCKLIFLLDTEEDTEGVTLADCDLTIIGMSPANDYDLFNDTFGTADPNANIEVPLRTDEAGNEREAIVLPRAAGGDDVEFRFTTPDGAVYTAIMDPDLALVGGYEYTFYITLQRTPTIIFATIENWLFGGIDYLIAK
ncbi:MAG: fimbrillin family protein [Tannerellaceae bacterium]|nr:fimbrillin family protein [Tannerellaceae bacterium]